MLKRRINCEEEDQEVRSKIQKKEIIKIEQKINLKT